MTTSLTPNGLVPRPNEGKDAATRQLFSTLPSRLHFIVRENGGTIEVPIASKIIIGRRNSTLPIDVDLGTYEAEELGVSRQHLKIEVGEDRIWVSDLDTVNGSRLNGEVMAPRRTYPLSSNDVLKLGRLHLIVLFMFD